MIACGKERTGGREGSPFSLCLSFLADGACVRMVSSFSGGDCVLPGLAQETDYQNLWSIVVLLLGSAMLFLKGVLESWLIEAIATS